MRTDYAHTQQEGKINSLPNHQQLSSTNDHSWNVINRKKVKSPNPSRNIAVNSIPLSNRFYDLTADDDLDAFNMREYNDDAKIQTNSHSQKQSVEGIQAGTSDNNRTERGSNNVINRNNNKRGETKKVVPGNSSYANMTSEGKKICIFGASITQRINIREFNRCLDDKKAIKTCWSGATVSKATYYMKPTIEEEKPDIILLNIGTNNLTKERQTEEETVGEILRMVDVCRSYGVNEIYVSGLTVRRGYTAKINNINRMLGQKAGENNFTFIDNTNIELCHLQQDGLHLQGKGTEILATNFINALNYKSIFNPFY